MKRLVFSLMTMVLSIMFLSTVAIAQPGSKKSVPSATFQKNWIDYDITEDGKKGMKIHTAFKVFAMKEVPSYLRIRFQKSDGTELKDNNKSFDDVDGNVAAFGDLKPGYDPTAYEDYDIFMPYDELDLSGGKYSLRMDIDVILEDGTLVTHLNFYEFDFTQPGSTPSNPSAKFDRIWIDYDVKEAGKLGMRIHVKFTTYSMKDLPSYLAVYFSKTDGTRLLTNNKDFRSTDGQVAIYKPLDIGYDPGVFNDLQLFLPYSELSLPSGTYNLRMETNLIYKEGGLIQALTKYDFEYTKP